MTHPRSLRHLTSPCRTTALADAAVTPSVGLGRDVRFVAAKVVGTALVHDRRAIHVALFDPPSPRRGATPFADARSGLSPPVTQGVHTTEMSPHQGRGN